MDDINNQVERASLLPNRYYLILNYEDEDSFFDDSLRHHKG